MLGFTNAEVNNFIILLALFTIYLMVNLAAVCSYYRYNEPTCAEYTEINVLSLILLPATFLIFLVKYTILIYDSMEPFMIKLTFNLAKILEYKPFKK